MIRRIVAFFRRLNQAPFVPEEIPRSAVYMGQTCAECDCPRRETCNMLGMCLAVARGI